MSALDRQEGGRHYKQYAIEPVEFCHRNGLSWCQANVVKYVIRFRDKGGIEDLQKARHYLDMLEEFEYGKKENIQEAQPDRGPAPGIYFQGQGDSVKAKKEGEVR